jgi:hypothetical protein
MYMQNSENVYACDVHRDYKYEYVHVYKRIDYIHAHIDIIHKIETCMNDAYIHTHTYLAVPYVRVSSGIRFEYATE